MRVLFLSAWYPHRGDGMWGLFVRKHAAAVAAQGAEVYVLYAVTADDVADGTEYARQVTAGVVEHYAYYKRSSGRAAALATVCKAYIGLVRRMEAEGFRPDVIHANVAGKEAMLAYLLHRRYGCPYVIMEHWSGYLPENGGYKGALRKAMTQFVIRHSACLIPVSPFLRNAMEHKGLRHRNCKTVFNVVDDFFYNGKRENRKGSKFRFIHVSCFDNRAKNVYGIVRAAALLWKERQDFELVMAGSGADYVETVKLAKEMRLDDCMRFTGELSPAEVKEWLYRSDAFVLFSNYETCAVVLEESMAAGCPIISTRVGIAIDEVDERTGIIVPFRDVQALAEAMEVLLCRRGQYDSEYIRAKAAKYSYAQVGGALCQIYMEVTQGKR